MATNHETGHAVNANNFVEKVLAINRYPEYDPSNPAILLDVLNPKRQSLSASIEAVATASNIFSLSITNRSLTYDQMDNRVTRSLALLESSGATPAEIKLGKSLVKKYRSERISDVPAAPEGGNGEPPATVSGSEQGYVKKLSHFKEIIGFYKIVPAYNPNEEDLKITALEAFATSVDGLNNDRNKKEGDWKTAISARNKLMYDGPDCAHALNNLFMKYVAGAFGKDSLFYQELMRYPIRALRKN